MISQIILNQLNNQEKEVRLQSLTEALLSTTLKEASPQYINNHIHTWNSFSPYSPTAAVYAAMAEGLATAGIIDHDSISGAEEFLRAGEIARFPVTCGIECRVSMKETPFFQNRFNNPDQKGIAYMTIHGIPKKYFPDVDAFFKPLREKRNNRNRLMVAKINTLLGSYGISLDFDKDVYPLSQAHKGGSITERHLMYAVALALIERFGTGEPLITFFENINISLSDSQKGILLDKDYPFYAYDIINILKAQIIECIYVPATDECPSLSEIIDFSESISAILSYPYLGDVTNSVTGDKKAQQFEDSFLSELFTYLDQVGINSISYMPTRNSGEQLKRLKTLCEQHNKFQISGEDINSPRQSFVCKAMDKPEFSNLIDSTWALIGHERFANTNPDLAFFSKNMKNKYPNLNDRIKWLAKEAKNNYFN